MARSLHSESDWRRPLAAAFLLLTLMLSTTFSHGQAQNSRSTWTNVDRIIAFGDVHGAYEEFVQLLTTAGVIDQALRWTAGSAHVVSLGDLLDRGGDSRKVMDLLMRLEAESAKSGGAVHVLLGNHEAMNLLGDLRYVSPGEFQSYISEEPAGLRERQRSAWIAQSSETGRAQAGAQFDQRFPPGYFGHRAAFASDGKYGRWLLTLPVAIVIDDTLFMHAGPSQVLAGLTVEEINGRYRGALAEYLNSLESLTTAGLLRPEDLFQERAAVAQRRMTTHATAANIDAVRRFTDADRNAMINVDAPNWYRGAALCNEVPESDVLRPLLAGFKVKRLVVGHTVTRNQRVASRFDGMVIKLDTGMNRAAYRGHPAALLIERGALRAIYSDGFDSAIAPETLAVTSVLDDSVVASMLSSGKVTVGAPRTPGVFEVTVELDGRRLPALFIQARADAVDKELAAYRLDRLLQLGLVPATARREVNGVDGVLQARPARWVTQAQVEAQSLRPGGWCEIAPQLELMYAFDVLIANTGRTRERIVYDAAEWKLLLTGHDRAFGTSRSLPTQGRTPQIGAEMRQRLSKLGVESLQRDLGDVLNDRARSALLARRDALLAVKASRAAN